MSPSYLLDARTNIIKAKMTWMNKYICSQQTRGKLARRAKSTNCTLFYCLFVLACVVSTNLCEQEKQYRSVSITYPSMRRRVFNKCVWRKYGIDKCRNVFFFLSSKHGGPYLHLLWGAEDGELVELEHSFESSLYCTERIVSRAVFESISTSPLNLA